MEVDRFFGWEKWFWALRLFSQSLTGVTMVKVQGKVKVAQSCMTLCDPMDYTAHEILQARILEWEPPEYWSLSLLQGIFPNQGSNSGLLHCRRMLYQLSHKESPKIKSSADIGCM